MGMHNAHWCKRWPWQALATRLPAIVLPFLGFHTREQHGADRSSIASVLLPHCCQQ